MISNLGAKVNYGLAQKSITAWRKGQLRLDAKVLYLCGNSPGGFVASSKGLLKKSKGLWKKCTRSRFWQQDTDRLAESFDGRVEHAERVDSLGPPTCSTRSTWLNLR